MSFKERFFGSVSFWEGVCWYSGFVVFAACLVFLAYAVSSGMYGYGHPVVVGACSAMVAFSLTPRGFVKPLEKRVAELTRKNEQLKDQLQKEREDDIRPHGGRGL